jgi:hypothetical protein
MTNAQTAALQQLELALGRRAHGDFDRTPGWGTLAYVRAAGFKAYATDKGLWLELYDGVGPS